jgi:hypothetical protein
MAAARERLGKHVHAAADTNTKMKGAGSAEWGKGTVEKELEVRRYSEDLSAEAEESPLLEAVTRERLVKTQTAVWKRLSGCCGDLWTVKISRGAVIDCSSELCA